MQVSQVDNASSGLRFGLLDVEPFEETKVVKKLGVKYRQTIRGLKPTESFDDFIRFNTHAVFQSFQMRADFELDKLSEIVATRRIKDYDADTELKNVLARIEKAKGRTNIAEVLKQLVQFFLDRRRAALDNMFQEYAATFLNSDFPMSIITDFTNFETTYTAVLEFIAAVVNQYSARLRLPEMRSDFGKYKKTFGRMQFALSPIIEQLEVSSFREQALRWYLLVSNAEDINAVFESKSLRIGKTDEQEFKRLLWEFQNESDALRKLVMGTNVDYFKPLIEENEIKSMFGEMVIALTS